MEITAIQAFVQVVRANGFSAAGRQLGVPRSTLSRQLQRLEAELGVRLVERTTRSFSLTEVGRAYFERCTRALDALESANEQAREAASRPRGLLRITAPIDIARHLVAPMLSEFRHRYPDVELALETSQRRVDLIAEGYDLALRGGERLDDSRLVARKLLTHVFALFASPAYLEARGVPDAVAELSEHDLIGFAPQGHALPWKLAGPDGPVELTPSSWLRANDMGFLQAAVEAGAGIGLVDVGIIADALRAGRVRRVLPAYSMHGGALYAIHPSARRVPLKLRVFLRMLAHSLRAR
jgi:DNA-binding transcriptional LysR family regulator